MRAARGCLLGLVLGDAVGAFAGEVPERGTLTAASAAQLACFTVDGLIRADIHSALRGPADAPAAVWQAYRRWSTVPAQAADDDAGPWRDGWLCQVPQLRAEATGAGAGVDTLVAALPVALYGRAGQAARLAAQIAAPARGDGTVLAATYATTVVSQLAEDADLDHASALAQEQVARLGHGPVPPALATATEAGPRDTDRLTALAGKGSAVDTLAASLYAVASYPERDQIAEAVRFAAGAGTGAAVAATCGAMLGAWHGPDALPVAWVARLELAWVADVLARDLVRQISQSPAGTEGSPATDPYWWDRYPAW